MQYLIDFIVRNLMALWPVARVYEWEVGMMVRRGIIQRPLSPGLHWRWWLIDETRTWPSTEMVVELRTGAVTTFDGHAVAIDGNIGYRVVDYPKSWRTVWSLEASVKALAAGVICSEIASRAWGELLGDSRASLEAGLVAALNEETGAWGILITRVRLVACVQARQHRHFIDGSLAR